MTDLISRNLDDFCLRFTETVFPLVTLYEYPKDYPSKYVARLWDGSIAKPTNHIMLFSDKCDAEEALGCFVRMERASKDDPCIICTYLP